MTELAPLLGRLLPPLLLVVGALLLVRWWSRAAVPADQALRVVARSGLTRGAVVAIVAVGRRRFLLGASDSGVRLLHELEPSTDDEQLPSTARGTEPAPAPGPWTGLLNRMRDRTVRVAGQGTGHASRP